MNFIGKRTKKLNDESTAITNRERPVFDEEGTSLTNKEIHPCGRWNGPFSNLGLEEY